MLETARGGLLREGLGYRARPTSAACLNVTADHLGLKGIETVEDLASVKPVVVEAVRRRRHSRAQRRRSADRADGAAARAAGLIWFSLRRRRRNVADACASMSTTAAWRWSASRGPEGGDHRPLRRRPPRDDHEGGRHPRDPSRHGRVQRRQLARRHRHRARARGADPHHPLGAWPSSARPSSRIPAASTSTTPTASG